MRKYILKNIYRVYLTNFNQRLMGIFSVENVLFCCWMTLSLVLLKTKYNNLQSRVATGFNIR